MTKTDWTAEEVRATVKKIKGHAMTVEERADMFDIADAFAERIAADEMAVPATFCVYMTKGGLYGYRETKEEVDKFVTETNATRTDIQVYAIPAFTHPPAQPAQEQPGWKWVPVAEVGNCYSIDWIGSGPIAPIIKQQNIKIGDKLFTRRPVQLARVEYPECSHDPSSCPENEVFGCCKVAKTDPTTGIGLARFQAQFDDGDDE